MSYFPLPSGGAVASVAGKTGVVVLDTDDVIRLSASDVVMGSFGQAANSPYQEIGIGEGPIAGTIPFRDGLGLFRVNPPQFAANPASLQSLRNATTSKPEIVALTGASTAAQIVTALQAAFTP